jgi:hypothetical protein
MRFARVSTNLSLDCTRFVLKYKSTGYVHNELIMRHIIQSDNLIYSQKIFLDIQKESSAFPRRGDLHQIGEVFPLRSFFAWPDNKKAASDVEAAFGQYFAQPQNYQRPNPA